MIEYSAAFDKAMRAGTTVIPLLTINRGPVTLLQVPLLPNATVTFDETQASRRTFQGTIANTGRLAPHIGTDPLAPYGIEGVVTCGLTIPGQSEPETIQIGVFRLNISTADTDGLITVSGPDRSAVVAAAQWEAPYSIAGSTPLDTAIAGILALKYPALPFIFDPGAHSQLLSASPTVYQEGSNNGDPWQNCIDLANQFGRELFIDEQGRAVLQLTPDPDATVTCYTYTPGTGNLALSGSHTIDTSQNVYNVVVASSSGTTINPPVQAEVEITDQNSPIYPNPNGFGRRPLFISSTELTTVAQCTLAAQGALNRKQGADNQIQFTAIPHPCHVPGDVVRYESDLLGIEANLVLSSWTLDVGLLAASSYTTRLSSLQVISLPAEMAAVTVVTTPVTSQFDEGSQFDDGTTWDS